MTDRQLGNRLKQWRSARNLTQADLAELVGVSRKTINTVENGVFVPSVFLSLKLARELGTSVESLFHLVPEKRDRSVGANTAA
ncbi:MAG: helix-turn-helix transcriptional regulator [Terriglobales bacterium]